MFVNFAKDQTDDDCLTDVVVSNGTAQPNAPEHRVNPPINKPQPPIVPPQPSKSPHLPGKSSDSKSKAGKPKKEKSSKGKSGSVAMRALPHPEEMAREVATVSRRASTESDGSNSGLQGESGKSRGSKRRAESSSKDPSVLFIVGGNSEESTL